MSILFFYCEQLWAWWFCRDVEVPHKTLLQTWLRPHFSVVPFHFQHLETVAAFSMLGWREKKAPLASHGRRISRMKVMRTYMRGDLVCCQSHEEVCSDSEFKPDVFSSPGGGDWLYYEAEAAARPLPSSTFEASLTRAPLGSYSWDWPWHLLLSKFPHPWVNSS